MKITYTSGNYKIIRHDDSVLFAYLTAQQVRKVASLMSVLGIKEWSLLDENGKEGNH